jgi:hypothetical protein
MNMLTEQAHLGLETLTMFGNISLNSLQDRNFLGLLGGDACISG